MDWWIAPDQVTERNNQAKKTRKKMTGKKNLSSNVKAGFRSIPSKSTTKKIMRCTMCSLTGQYQEYKTNTAAISATSDSPATRAGVKICKSQFAGSKIFIFTS